MDHIVVYRSRVQQNVDEYWANSPELIVWAFYILAALIVVGIAYSFLSKRFK